MTSDLLLPCLTQKKDVCQVSKAVRLILLFQESFHLCRMGLLGTSRQKAVMSAWILFRFTFGGFTPNIAVIADSAVFPKL